MEISLGDREIKQAIADYVQSQGIETAGKKVDITLKSGRKKKDSEESSGHTAQVVISAKIDPSVAINTEDQDADGEADGGSDSLFTQD